MPNVNHNEMCKFENKFSVGFDLVIERLGRIQDRMLGRDIGTETDILQEVHSKFAY